MRIILLIVILGVSGCGIGTSKDNIVGQWKGKNENDGILVFEENGNFEILDTNGNPMKYQGSKPKITWETITEVDPNQIYITMVVNDSAERVPLGIYKINNDKLILREPITFHNTIGGISMGVSRYEMPSDFSGPLKVFIRM